MNRFILLLSIAFFVSACNSKTDSQNDKAEEAEDNAGQAEVAEEIQAEKESKRPEMPENVIDRARFFVNKLCDCFAGHESREALHELPKEERKKIAECVDIVKFNTALSMVYLQEEQREVFRQEFLDYLENCPCKNMLGDTGGEDAQ